MRALLRTRLLAALCALLLVAATTAQASKVGKPIDRPDDPGPPTTEVGDPDEPGDIIAVVLLGRVYMIPVPRFFAKVSHSPLLPTGSKTRSSTRRGRN